MAEAINSAANQMLLRPFHVADAEIIARWVETEEELHWVAPSTPPPLTPRKVAEWQKPNGDAFVLTSNDPSDLLGYGELNTMQRDSRDLWLGHLIVRPDLRGCGIGQSLVRALLGVAFDRYAARRVMLVVFPSNRAAIACYRRAGFRIMGEEFHRFGDRGPRYRLLRLEASAQNAAGSTVAVAP